MRHFAASFIEKCFEAYGIAGINQEHHYTATVAMQTSLGEKSDRAFMTHYTSKMDTHLNLYIKYIANYTGY